MNFVTFPGLGLSFNVPKVAFQVLGFNIYSYAVCIVIGMVLAFILCRNSEDNYYIKFDGMLDTIFFAIIFGIIGARLYYVLFHLDYYLFNISQIINIRDGGLAIYGGLLTGIMVIVFSCQNKNKEPLDLLDYIAPFVALAQAIGRWGNFFNVEAYGYESSSILRMGIETANGYQEVHPVFLYESVANLIIFFILRKMQKDRKFEGQITYTYLALYAFVRMFLEKLRVDSLMFFDIRISWLVSVIVLFISCAILLKKTIKYIRLGKKDPRKKNHVGK